MRPQDRSQDSIFGYEGYIQNAIELHRQGKLLEAAEIYQKIITDDPQNFDALHMLGVIASQQKQYQQAAQLIYQALTINPAHAAAFSNFGMALAGLNKYKEAIAAYDQAISIQADFVDALNNKAIALQALGDVKKALEMFNHTLSIHPNHTTSWLYRGNLYQCNKNYEAALADYKQALRIDPNNYVIIYNQGIALQALNKHAAAAAAYQKAIKIKPNYAKAHLNLGVSYEALGQTSQALLSYQEALRIKPDYAPAYCNIGVLLKQAKRYEEALSIIDKGLSYQPNYINGLFHRGVVLQDLKRFSEALMAYDRVISLKPDYAKAYVNRGSVLQDLDQLEASLESYDKALQLDPNIPEAHSNRGFTCQLLLRHQEALFHYQQACALSPDYAKAHFNESVCRLLLGDYLTGWEKYEWRWKNTWLELPWRDFSQPLWLGQESLKNKTILLHAEQGYGDTLQFLRYVPLIAKMGARIILEVQPLLKPLFSGFKGVDTLIALGETIPAFDTHCPLLSLPLSLRTTADTIPNKTPYLKAPISSSTAWKKKLAKLKGLKIGIAWSGNRKHKNDKRRSIELDIFSNLFSIDANFFILQTEVSSAEKVHLKKYNNVFMWTEELTDFSETAGLINHLNLVISVDTSVAHLTGALGKPLWVLLPQTPDWRWLLDRSDSPWYSSARLFRQASFGNWQAVLDEVKKTLLVYLQNK